MHMVSTVLQPCGNRHANWIYVYLGRNTHIRKPSPTFDNISWLWRLPSTFSISKSQPACNYSLIKTQNLKLEDICPFKAFNCWTDSTYIGQFRPEISQTFKQKTTKKGFNLTEFSFDLSIRTSRPVFWFCFNLFVLERKSM